MTIFHSIILGIVQGLTEFLPVSSSGHLVLFSKLPWWAAQPLVFDTTLHLATALTLVVYFYKDIQMLITSVFKDFLSFKTEFKKYSAESKLAWFLVVGSIPAAILGFLFESDFEEYFRSVHSVALFLLLGSLLMWGAQKFSKPLGGTEKLSPIKSLVVGFFQSLALFPGMSRSGSTISGSLIIGLDRMSAARFSFLMSIPIVLMAGLYKLVSTDWTQSSLSFGTLFAGFSTSFVVGLLVVHFLLSYLKKKDLSVFIWYRVILAILLIVVVR